MFQINKEIVYIKKKLIILLVSVLYDYKGLKVIYFVLKHF